MNTSSDEIKNESEDRVHHPYSPSTLQNLEACPCYEGRQTTHIRAIAGTKAHKVTETLVDDNSLDDDDAEAAAECLDFYQQRLRMLEESRNKIVGELAVQLAGDDSHPDITWPNADSQTPEILELQETYLPIDDKVFLELVPNADAEIFRILRVIGTTAGYFDRAIIDHTGIYAEAFDWKFGLWQIEKCENNLQAISYVLGLFKKFPTLQAVRFFFKQPALDLVSEHLFKREQIPALYLRACVVVARAREARGKGDFSTANPTIPGCLFCKHIGVCPKVADFACKIGSKFAPLKIPASVTPTMIQDPQNTGLGMQLAQVMKVWSDAFRQVTADRVLNNGAPLPAGYKLVTREGSRKVIDMDGFRKQALQILTEEEFSTTLDVSLGAVEKAISDKSPRGFKKDAIKNFKSCLEENNLVERGNGCAYLQANNE